MKDEKELSLEGRIHNILDPLWLDLPADVVRRAGKSIRSAFHDAVRLAEDAGALREREACIQIVNAYGYCDCGGHAAQLIADKIEERGKS